ncbi:MAG TPA: nuclear transport factor 2 family protein [Blastocatellia bacterium]|nr:nuclear transport factor 2 family protein [Blastocatellia bacterium]
MSSQPAHVEQTENTPASDESIVAALDTEYQEAVKNNDVTVMNLILADDFVFVTGKGTVYTKSDLLQEAAAKRVIYERQEDSSRTVRIWKDTAVVTALLWAKGTDRGEPFDYRIWFSDTYVRTANGWRYVFGQSSLRIPSS